MSTNFGRCHSLPYNCSILDHGSKFRFESLERVIFRVEWGLRQGKAPCRGNCALDNQFFAPWTLEKEPSTGHSLGSGGRVQPVVSFGGF